MAHNVLVIGFSGRVFNFPTTNSVEVSTLRKWLDEKQGTGAEYHLTRGGTPLTDDDIISGEKWGTTLIRAHPLLSGGKGGFGALIRAVGSRMKRGRGSKDACRDLSGRRLRDVNAQKKVAEWLENEPERKRKKQEEKRKRLLKKKVPPKHFFDDQAYMEQLRNNEEEMDDALKQGLQASGSGKKRKQPVASDDSAGPSTSAKRQKFWVGGEGDDLSSEESSGDEIEDSGLGPRSSKMNSAGLNSAGSSDETGPSKPSDEEDTSSTGPSNDGASENDTSPHDDATPTIDGDHENGGKTNSEGNSVVEVTIEERQEEGGQVTEQEKRVEGQQNVKDEETRTKDDGPLDLNDYSSAEELETVGAERLKSVLQSMGLKCGGTLQERAQRLFSAKGKSPEELDPSLFAKAGKSRKRKNKA